MTTIFNCPPTQKSDDEIFIDDVDFLVEQTYPLYEGQHPVFSLFGTRTGGFADIWLRTKNWKELPEVTKWKYVALCERYWHYFYKYVNDEVEYKKYKENLKEWAKKNPDFLITLEYLEQKEGEIKNGRYFKKD